MRSLVLMGAAVAALSAAPASAADFTFDFSSTSVIFGRPVSGSGVFTTSGNAMLIGGQTAFAVTSVTGTFNGSPITGPTLGTFGNYFTSGPTFVDGSGIRFNTTTTSNVSLFYDSNARSYRVNAINQGGSSLVAATSSAVTAVSAVPEPGTWAMMIIGFGAAGAALRRRKNKMTTRVAFA